MSLILVSHGKMAIETLRSAELILGKIPDAAAFGLEPTEGPQQLTDSITMAIEGFSSTAPIYVLLDVLGGTPSNVMVNLISKYSNLNVISGLNLPMVIKYGNQILINQELNSEILMNAAKEGIKNISQLTQEVVDDDDEEE